MHNNQVPVQLNKAYGRHVTHHISTAVPNPVVEYETVMINESEYEKLTEDDVPIQTNEAYGRHVTDHTSTALPDPAVEYETIMSYEPEYEKLPGDTTEEDYI